MLIPATQSHAVVASSTNYRIDVSIFSGGGGDSGSTNYDVFHSSAQSTPIGDSSSSSYLGSGGFWYAFLDLANPLWADAVVYPDGWRGLWWFGFFNINNDPWIWHEDHGWLYPFGTATSSIWFWDVAMNAYWWTSDSTYADVYRYSPATWLYYHSGSTPNRNFYNYTSLNWETW